MSDPGIVWAKPDVDKIIRDLASGSPRFSDGDLGIQQAVNAIMALQRPPTNVQEIALTVTCPYCGRTPGNRCSGAARLDWPDVDAHPTRMRAALEARA